MAKRGERRKLAANSKDTQESVRNGWSENFFLPGITEDYISQVSEEIEGRIIEKLAQEFSRLESRILGALSKHNEFLLNLKVRTCSSTVPGTSQNNGSVNVEPTGDRSLIARYPDMEFLFVRPKLQLTQTGWRHVTVSERSDITCNNDMILDNIKR